MLDINIRPKMKRRPGAVDADDTGSVCLTDEPWSRPVSSSRQLLVYMMKIGHSVLDNSNIVTRKLAFSGLRFTQIESESAIPHVLYTYAV